MTSRALAPLLLVVFSLRLPAQTGRWAVAIHGGTATMTRESLSVEELKTRKDAIDAALRAAAAVLDKGGPGD